jgi:cbb3-type cytochrome oxidase subunit 3
MCRTSAAAGGDEAMKAFDLAVLVLLIPTILLFCGILAFAFRYRNHPRADTSAGCHPERSPDAVGTQSRDLLLS